MLAFIVVLPLWFRSTLGSGSRRRYGAAPRRMAGLSLDRVGGTSGRPGSSPPSAGVGSDDGSWADPCGSPSDRSRGRCGRLRRQQRQGRRVEERHADARRSGRCQRLDGRLRSGGERRAKGTLEIEVDGDAYSSADPANEARLAAALQNGVRDLTVLPSRAWESQGVKTFRALQAPFLVSQDGPAADPEESDRVRDPGRHSEDRRHRPRAAARLASAHARQAPADQPGFSLRRPHPHRRLRHHSRGAARTRCCPGDGPRRKSGRAGTSKRSPRRRREPLAPFSTTAISLRETPPCQRGALSEDHHDRGQPSRLRTPHVRAAEGIAGRQPPQPWRSRSSRAIGRRRP